VLRLTIPLATLYWSLIALLVGTVVSSVPSVVEILILEVLISLLVKLKTANSPSVIPVSSIEVTFVVFAIFVSA
jgi:hypothetical protein